MTNLELKKTKITDLSSENLELINGGNGNTVSWVRWDKNYWRFQYKK
jgi:hypothetical protein